MDQMFNPTAHLQEIRITGDEVCLVVDDLLADPEGWVAFAQDRHAQFAKAPFNAYPGVERALESELTAHLRDYFDRNIRARLGGRRTLNMYSRLSMVTTEPKDLTPLQRLCHRDRFHVETDQLAAAMVVYLFKDQRLGGTSFFEPKWPIDQTDDNIRRWSHSSNEAFDAEFGATRAYLADSNDHFRLVKVIEPKWNRAIFYNGSLFHSSHIRHPELMANDPQTGRLTLNSFLVCKRIATS